MVAFQLILLVGLYIYAARMTFIVMAASDPNRDSNSFFTPGLISPFARGTGLVIYYTLWPLWMAVGWWNSRHERAWN